MASSIRSDGAGSIGTLSAVGCSQSSSPAGRGSEPQSEDAQELVTFVDEHPLVGEAAAFHTDIMRRGV